MPAGAYNSHAKFGCMPGPQPLGLGSLGNYGLFGKKKAKNNTLSEAKAKRDAAKMGSPKWNTWHKVYLGLGGTDSPPDSEIEDAMKQWQKDTIPWTMLGGGAALAVLAALGVVVLKAGKGKKGRKKNGRRRRSRGRR